MSRKKLQNVDILLERLKTAYDLKNDRALAAKLKISPVTISAWKKRGNPDWNLIFTFCKDLDMNRLLTGIGGGIEADTHTPAAQTPAHPQVKDPGLSYSADPNIASLLAAAEAVLSSNNEIVKAALTSNIIAFHYTVKCDKEMNDLKRTVDVPEKIVNPTNPNTKVKET